MIKRSTSVSKRHRELQAVGLQRVWRQGMDLGGRTNTQAFASVAIDGIRIRTTGVAHNCA